MIRRTVMVLLIGVGVAGAAALILMGIALATGSTAAIVVGVVLGILAVGAAAGGMLFVSARMSQRLDALSTRLSAIDLRLDTQQETASQLAELRRQVGADAERVEEAGKQAAKSRRELRILRRRVPAGFLTELETDVEDLDSRSLMPRRLAFESALQLGRAPANLIDEEEAHALYREYVARGEYLQLRPLIENFDVLIGQRLTDLRALFQYFRRTGYWDLAVTVAERLYAVTGGERDHLAAEKIRREIEVFREPTLVTTELPEGEAYDPSGPIVHMVGRVLPETQTGYTLRTQYTATAQAARGLRPVIVGQSGIAPDQPDEERRYTLEGIEYVVLPGSRRNEGYLDDWLRVNMEELAQLVQELRPSILHAQSDFFNALIVHAVGKRYGIPTVYESRGFWEESWLSRIVNANGWTKDESIRFAMYGRPPAYELRKHAEESARLLPDHVFTLAEVMRDHILDSSYGQLSADRVSIVPNAVDTSAFPVQERDQELADQVGLPDGAVTIGYISSIVEYEGIDTLLEAYRLVRLTSEKPTCLLLVGDGDHAPALKEYAATYGIEDVFFTGRVPHEDILRYYGLIDLFVVPRKKSDVTDLVTPLKPFEAFSTGRTVVLSDVGALQEIADQCGAVETFRAGDADDLARVLRGLLDDDGRRRDLGTRAARWVRNHRTWLSNVGEYYRVYRKLGCTAASDPVVEAELALEASGANPGELVGEFGTAPLPPLRGWFTSQESWQSARSILDEGWRFASFEPVPVSRLDDWAYYGAQHRSWGFQLHAWKFMDSLFKDYDKTGDRQWIVAAVEIALGWIEKHDNVPDANDQMAWYDMALSLRTPRLTALILRAARIPGLRDQVVVLGKELVRHLHELHQDRAFNPHNNHGFYTAASQVHAAKYAYMMPEIDKTADEGRARLAMMAVSQFAADGVHLEHSPDYHRMLLDSFESAVEDGLIDDEDVEIRIRRAAHVLGWMIQPDGALVQFGDSPEKQLVGGRTESIDPQTQFLLSDGREGERPDKEMAVYGEGGYAFVRSPQPDGTRSMRDSGYLAFSAAFHSRAHKHADDLNVVWYDRGQQILADSGRFGYGELLPDDSPLRRKGFYYAAPERQYVEGTMAHNTLMMDGHDQDRRTREPYGSAIGECFRTEDGTFDLSGRVHHADYIHRRRMVYRPGQELLIKDAVFSQSPDEREGILWFNVAGHFDLESADEEVVFVSGGEHPLRLAITGPGRLIEPVRGQSEPLRGWRSRQDRTMEPTWSLGFAIPIEVRASVNTVLRLE